ncbi:hypothetical protein AN618_17550 [Fervidicola ferrireducens]|uniref:CRISPR-associated protein Csh1 n=1 Tax=Fervidicola ferrireducens TaxID=520764 RepID=A0A140L5M0_9FIRM|nr:TIGR02556 family CRISPR-associated protein [Fervidicola ferrireducens]KXG75845.1 hypothetical protein AN618_17550 [Fervidicola ferrireducens]
MIEAIKILGESMMKTAGSEPFLSSLIDQVDADRYIVIFDFKTDDDIEIKIDTWGVDAEKLDKVKWVGNVKGNNPQDRLTTDNLQYLVSQSIPNLAANLPEGSDLKIKLQDFIDKFYYKIPGLKGFESRYAYIWDLDKIGIKGQNLLSKKNKEKIAALAESYEFGSPEFYEAYVKKEGKAKDLASIVADFVGNWLEKQWDIPRKSIGLYTIRLDGQLLAEHPDYHKYLENRLVDDVFDEEEFVGQCHICQKSQEKLTKNFTRFRLLKFYINDKKGFASGLADRGFFKNYAVCKECYKHLLVGERTIENHFRSRLGEADVYLIPEFYQNVDPEQLHVKEWAEYLKRKLQELNKFEAWQEFQDKISDDQLRKFGKDSYLLNFLFARRPPGSSEVKVLRFIQDIPPHRLDELKNAMIQVRDLFGEGEMHHFNLDYTQIYFLLPIRKVKNEPQIGIYLDILEALFKGHPLKLSLLTDLLMETVRVHAFEKYDAYVQKKNDKSDSIDELDRFLIMAQFFIFYLKRLNMIKELRGGELELVAEKLVPEEIKSYWEKVGLSDPQKALFLLGYLIGEIGKKQYQEGKTKPIMNKLNYQGMTEGKIKVLSSEILDKLYQNKIWNFNERIYAAMKELLDKSLGKFNSAEENVYWILSGYAFSTARGIMSKSAEKTAEKEEEV